MKLEARQKKLRGYPVQLIETRDGVLVRRGCVQLAVSGADATAVLHRIFECASRPAGVTEDELAAEFAGPDRGSVRSLIVELAARRLLVPTDDPALPSVSEGSLDVFYWHFGDTPRAVADRIEERRITVLGVNGISRQLARTLRASGVERFEIVDHPLLRNLSYVDAGGELSATSWSPDLPQPLAFEAWATAGEDLGVLVATADFGGLTAMRRWNEFAVEMRCHFLPVVLQDLVGYVGPLVIPGETACYECLRARENSNLPDPESARAAEEHAWAGQAVAAAHPAMASVVADLAAIELTRFYGRAIPNPRAGTLLEVNLLTTSILTRKVLKVPRCRVCSPLLSRGSASPEKNVFLPGNAPRE